MKIHKLVIASLRGNSGLSFQGIKELQRKDLLWVAWIAFVGIVAVLAFFIYYILSLYRNLLLLGIQTGQYELLFFYATLGSWVIIFLFGIPLSLSVLYYSKDIHLLITLPVKPSEIIISRITLLLLFSLPFSLILHGFAVYVYGDAVAYSFQLFLSAFIHILIGPLFPLSCAILFVVFLAKIVNFGKYQTAFEVGGMFLSLVLIFGIQALISRNIMEPERWSSLSGITGLFKQLIAFLFPAAWIARSFFPGKGIPFLFLSVCLYFSVTCLIFFVTRIMYLQDVRNRIVIIRKKIRPVKNQMKNKQGSIIGALIKKELHVLFSNSTFIFQTVGELCIFPILLIVFSLILPGELNKEIIKLLPEGPFAGLIIFGLCIAFTCINSLSSTSLSREGRTFAMSLIIPVPGKIHIISKLFLSLIFYFPVFMIDVSILMVFLKTDLLSLVYIIPGAIVFLIFTFFINITIDLKRPVLKWTHPMQAVKNNLNVLISLGISFGYLIIIGLTGWFLLMFLKVQPFFFGLGVVIIIGIMDLLLFPNIFRFADKRYSGGIEMD